MLTIKTSKENMEKSFINDVEAWFNADSPKLSEMYLDSESVKILQNIEGMKVRHSDWIEAKFGSVPLTQISTGAKVALLCNTMGDNYSINTDEAGQNIIQEIMRLSKDRNIEIQCGRVLYNFPDDYKAVVEDEMLTGKDITYAMEYLLEED